jgi:hypothetical protein
MKRKLNDSINPCNFVQEVVLDIGVTQDKQVYTAANGIKAFAKTSTNPDVFFRMLTSSSKIGKS